MALVGHVYIQDTDPGTPPSGGYEWTKPTTGETYIRNGANTAWVFKGNVNLPNLGNVPVAGATMTGPITGGHGLAPLTSPDFQTSAKRGGKNLALKSDVNAMAAVLRSEFSSVAANLVAGALTTSATKANVAMKMGSSGHLGPGEYFTVPPPQYPDLTSADYDDCVWIVSPKELYWFDDTVTSGFHYLKVVQHPTELYKYQCYALDGAANHGGSLYYFILGVR